MPDEQAVATPAPTKPLTQRERVEQELLTSTTPVPIQPPVATPPPVIPLTQPERAPEVTPPVEPKLFAGKYKTPEELEHGYSEAEKAMHAANQRAAELERQLQQVKTVVVPPAAIPIPAKPSIDFLDLLVNKPDEFTRTIVEEVAGQVARVVQIQQQTREIETAWRTANPDLAQTDYLVSAEIAQVVQKDPALVARLKDPATASEALQETLNTATQNLRSRFTSAFAAGKQEAMQVQGETRGTSISTVPQSSERGASAQPAEQAPATDSFDDYLARRRAENARLMGTATKGTGPLRQPVSVR